MLIIQISQIEFIEIAKRSQEVLVVFRHNEKEYSLSLDLSSFERFAYDEGLLTIEVRPTDPSLNPHAHAKEKLIDIEELFKEDYQSFVYAVHEYLKYEFNTKNNKGWNKQK